MGLDVEGHRGGLVLAWKRGLTVNLVQLTQNWIHTQITRVNGFTFFLTGVYGPSNFRDWSNLWNFIIECGFTVQEPWLLIEDFNQVIRALEKSSANMKIDGASTF